MTILPLSIVGFWYLRFMGAGDAILEAFDKQISDFLFWHTFKLKWLNLINICGLECHIGISSISSISKCQNLVGSMVGLGSEAFDVILRD